ncbi:MAG: DUF1801 domain-containing protein [Bacteroidetes bacterium]|nr:DUF1801 domain-containing protein [Bacteroidota bacterium]
MMQNVSFKSFEEFLDFLPEDELKVTEFLRKIVFECIPDATEKLAYNVPYYKRHKNICFIWPASILWGKKKTYSGVRFGFVSGHLLPDEPGFLEKGDRKFVYWKDFGNLKEINVELLKAYIYEAVLVDQKLAKKSLKKPKKSPVKRKE